MLTVNSSPEAPVARAAIMVLRSRCLFFRSSHRNSFKDLVPADVLNSCPILKCVAAQQTHYAIMKSLLRQNDVILT